MRFRLWCLIGLVGSSSLGMLYSCKQRSSSNLATAALEGSATASGNVRMAQYKMNCLIDQNNIAINATHVDGTDMIAGLSEKFTHAVSLGLDPDTYEFGCTYDAPSQILAFSAYEKTVKPSDLQTENLSNQIKTASSKLQSLQIENKARRDAVMKSKMKENLGYQPAGPATIFDHYSGSPSGHNNSEQHATFEEGTELCRTLIGYTESNSASYNKRDCWNSAMDRGYAYGEIYGREDRSGQACYGIKPCDNYGGGGGYGGGGSSPRTFAYLRLSEGWDTRRECQNEARSRGITFVSVKVVDGYDIRYPYECWGHY